MRLKELREEKKLSQESLAKLVGTSQRNIGRWENEENEPTYSQLLKLANFFEVSIDYLVGRTDEFDNVVSSNAGAHTLSPEEQDVVNKFRKLNKMDKNSIVLMLNAFIERADGSFGNDSETSSAKKAN